MKTCQVCGAVYPNAKKAKSCPLHRLDPKSKGAIHPLPINVRYDAQRP